MTHIYYICAKPYLSSFACFTNAGDRPQADKNNGVPFIINFFSHFNGKPAFIEKMPGTINPAFNKNMIS